MKMTISHQEGEAEGLMIYKLGQLQQVVYRFRCVYVSHTRLETRLTMSSKKGGKRPTRRGKNVTFPKTLHRKCMIRAIR